VVKVIVQHHVRDYDTWLPVYLEHGSVRTAHGGLGHSVNRDVNDPNNLVVVNVFETLEGAMAFTQDPSLPEAMQRGGVDSDPQVWMVDEADAREY
jgi:heme-degrading monooxygenase HmoA